MVWLKISVVALCLFSFAILYAVYILGRRVDALEEWRQRRTR